MPPLVVTLLLDDDSQARLDTLRRTYFPPERNLVPGHVSLFHALPGDELERLLDDARGAVDGVEPFDVPVTGLFSLGRGVAYRAGSAALDRLRADLAGRWSAWLTRQDAQPFRAHVTVTNKVDKARAAAVLAELGARALPEPLRAEGVAFWWYVGGPWEPAGLVRLGTPQSLTGQT